MLTNSIQQTVRWFTQEPRTSASHTGEQQLQAPEYLTNRMPGACRRRVLVHARTKQQCKPHRRATAARTEHLTNKMPRAWINHMLHHARTQHQRKPHRRATAASTEHLTHRMPRACSNLCWLTQEPSTNASHTDEQQLHAQSI